MDSVLEKIASAKAPGNMNAISVAKSANLNQDC